MTDSPQAVLQIDDLHVRYADGIDAIRGLSLSMSAGERVGLIGPNGAGKTTLMLSIMDAVRFTGRIVVDGIEVSKKTDRQSRSRCGMIFQDAEDHLFMPTLLDDVAFGPLNQGCSIPQAERLALAAIQQVGLTGLEQRSAHHMSGGQKRAAALATVLSMQVRLLLLDEPGANLDNRSRRKLIKILDGRTEAMLLATHDLPMVRSLCSRVILMDEGRMIADRPAAELLDDMALLKVHGLVD
jgi:cobalt/nickel transport system ATP-binding protein